MSSVRHAMAFSFAQRYIAFLIQLGLSMVMARLLTPSETGIFSLAAAVVGVAGLLRDFGVSEYVIQEKNLTHDGLRSALGLTIIISWSIALLLFGVANLVADFYREPGILNIIHVLVLNFVLLPLGTMTFAMLNKEMAFKTIFWVQTATNAGGAMLCIYLAYHGFSYMSMAWSSLFSIGLTVILLTLVRPKETLMLPSFRNLGRATKFGGALTIGRLSDQLSLRAPDFLIGNFLGFHEVGIYSKSFSLLNAFQDFFASAIGRVVLPAFAKIKNDSAQISAQYARVIRLTSLFPMAFFGFCGMFAEPIVMLLFGQPWLGAVPVIRILSVNGIIGAPYMILGSVLTANGQIRDLLRMQLVGTAIFIPVIYFASHFSLEAVAYAAMLAGFPRFMLMQMGLNNGLKFSFGMVVRAAWPSFLIASAAMVAAFPFLFLYHASASSALLAIATGGPAALSVGVILIFITAHPVSNEIRILWKNLAVWNNRA